MELKQAIEILEYHQRWRKGEESVMLIPSILTEAIDNVLEEVKKWQSKDCGLIHSTDFNGKCFNCGKQVFENPKI